MNKVFVVFVAIIHLAYVSGQQYKCIDDDLTKYELQDGIFTCEEGKFCNFAHLGEKFQPCVDIEKACGALFKCNPDNEKEATLIVAGNEQPLTCRGNTVCNNQLKKNCDICVPKICPKDVFKCKDNKHFIWNGIKDPIECPKEQVCNEEKGYPCKPCISPDDVPTTTTEKAEPGVQKPNCSDGQGWKKPCRPGSKTIYYRCINKVFWWEYEVVHCSYLEKDYLCKDDKTIC